ncbi:hypothetical protein BGX27_010738 [Mortierella sp. AM989]|nr:hypothetical protein BGX27_010738 [Mortierella sp. AM989]
MQEPNYIVNPPRRKAASPKRKIQLSDWHLLVRAPMSDNNPRKSNLEKAMEEDLAELRIVFDMFLNSRMNEAEALLRGRNKPDSIYYHLGRSLLDAFRACLTFQRDDIEKTMKSLDLSLKVANAQRKKSSSIVGVGTVKAIGNWVVGNVGANSFKGMTRLEKHAELVYAESLLLRAAISILYHQDFWSLIEESVSLRTSFAIYNGLKSHIETVEHEHKAGGDISEYYLDEHLITGLMFSISFFNIAISFMPNVIIKLLQFVGFPSDRDWGLALLNSAGQWDPYATTFQESPFEFQQRLVSRTNEGMRRQLCDVAQISIHLIAASFLSFRHVDYEFAEQINNYNLHKYPDSAIFLYLKGRHAQVNTRLEEAIDIYESIVIQPEWKNFSHACCIEQTLCAIILQDFDLACTKSRILLRESNWAKATFRYLAAITTMKRGWEKEAKKVPDLMKKVESGIQSFCGVEVFAETFCARKANRYLNEGHLILPDYDFLVLWNGFDMMPMKYLRVALSNIMVEVQRLDALLPPSMVAIADNPLPKGGYTLEATKGILGTIRSNVHSLTKADKLKDYEFFYDDYCIAYYLLGTIAQKMALFPDEPFDVDMCTLAVKSYKTVFRYAPYIKDDTYVYYISHYNVGMIMMSQGRLDLAGDKFKYLLNTISPPLSGLPALLAGKGRNSLETLVLMKAHAAMFLVNEDRDNASDSISTTTTTTISGKASPPTSSKSDGVWRSSSATTVNVHGIDATFSGMALGATTGSTTSYSDRGSLTSASSPVAASPNSPSPIPNYATSSNPISAPVSLTHADSPFHF